MSNPAEDFFVISCKKVIKQSQDCVIPNFRIIGQR